MSLPKLTVPTYTLEMPSTKQKIKYRPFLVKEEKIIAMAMQEGNDEAILEALKDIVDNCTFNKIDVNKLTSFDFEYIFINLRSKSKGNIVDLSFQCKNMVKNDDGEMVECNHVNKFQINLDNIVVKSKDDAHTTKIMLTDDIGIKMKYPTINEVVEVQKAVKEGGSAAIFDKLKYYIECIFEGEKVHDSFSDEELVQFIEDMTEEQFAKVEKFFVSIPTIMMDITIHCSKCGFKETVTLEGLQSFLD